MSDETSPAVSTAWTEPEASTESPSSSGSAAARRRGRRRRLGWMGAGLVLIGVAAAGAWVAGTRVRSPEQAAANAAPPRRTLVTVPVERRVLESTVVTRGDVAPDVAISVPGPAGPSGVGQAVVTGLFVEVGDEVSAGIPVVEVSGRPVFVMAGERPVYRELGPGATGADVRQLQAGLVVGGCESGESGMFDEATKTCVAELYEQAGYSVVRSSDTEQADLVTAREAVADAADQLEDAQAALIDAEVGPTDLELLDAQQAVDTARTGLESATTTAADSRRAATAAVGDALRSVNAALVAADPDAQDDQAGFAGRSRAVGSAGDDDDSGDSGDGQGDPGGNASGGGAGVAARADAAEALREALEAVTTARVTGDVAVGEAQAALTRAEAELAEMQAPPDLSDEERAVAQATTARERADADLSALEEAAGPTVPMGELVFVPSLPARVDSLTAVVGESAGGPEMEGGPSGGGGALMVLASAGLVVNAELAAGDAGLVSVGAKAVLLDEASRTTIDAEVTAVGTSLVHSATGGLVSPVTLVGDEELPAEWSGRNVRVTFTAASTQSPVLVVPEIAVSSGSDGHERVEVADDDGTIVTVGVRTGLQADGYVEVTPLTAGELDEGDDVVTDR